MTEVLESAQTPPDAPVAPEPRGRARLWLQSAVIAAPLVLLGVMAWAKRNMFEDGFIYLHIVQNVLAGNGPVFNAGERVETYTGVLWLVVLSALGAVTPFALEWIAVVTGIVLTLGAAGVAMFASSRLVRLVAPTAFLLPLGVLVFASVAVVWMYASTGLETGLTFMWLALCLAVLVAWARSRSLRVPWPGLVLLGLGPLVRPELALDSAVFLLVVLLVGWRRSSWWGRVRVLVIALALPAVYQVFRMGYFGMVVANTAIAKEGTMPRPDQGWAYALDFANPYLLVIPAVALLLGAYLPLALGLRRGEAGSTGMWALLALPVAGALNAAFVVLMGGDYLHGRLLLPAFFAMLAPVAVVPLQRSCAASLVVLPWSVLSLASLRTTDVWPVPFGHLRSDGVVTPADFDWPGPNIPAGLPPGLHVRVGAAPFWSFDVPLADGVPNPAIATGAIGLQSYVLGPDAYIFDYLGLADVLTSHLELTERGTTGHEKNLPTPWLVAALTAPGVPAAQFEVLQPAREALSLYRPLIPNSTGEQLQRETDLARAALACPAIADLRESVRAPLTPARFLGNLTEAWGRTQMRVPPDPAAAYVKFCGSDRAPDGD